MPAGPFHEFYIDELERAFHSVGIETKRNVATRSGRNTRYGDLVAIDKTRIVLVEIEMTTARIGNDLRKRDEISKGKNVALWIVVANSDAEQAAKSKIRELAGSNLEKVFVLTVGAAVKRIKAKKTFVFAS